MKRSGLGLFMIIPVCGFVSTFMSGCGANNNADQDLVITLNDPGDRLFPIKDYFETDRVVNVSAEGDYFISDINGAFFTDDYAFLLDHRQAVSKVDLKTGKIVSQLYQTGRGPNDYLNALNLTGDDEHLYLLDFGKSVHVYDHDLNHQEKYNIEYMPGPSSFTKVKEGFMFLNSFENDSIGTFVVTDSRCRKTETFLKKEPVQEEDDDEMIMGFAIFIGKYFIQDSDGKVVCHNPVTDELYIYDGKTISKKCQFKMPEEVPGKSSGYIKQLFSFNGNTLVNYFCGKGACYALFDKNCNLIEEGLGVNEDPFFPICQKGNKLMTAFITDGEDESVQAQIVIYKTKNN